MLPLSQDKPFSKWLLVACLVLALGQSGMGQDLQRFTFEKGLMGTSFKIILYTSSDSLARQAAHAAFERIAELNHIMSDYDPDSEIRQLKPSSKWQAIHPDLWRVLKCAKKLSKKSKGAFEVAIGQLTQGWRKAIAQQAFPPADSIRFWQRQSSRWRIKKHRPKLKIKTPIRFDLGGIAKGYAVDEAMKVLRQFGIHIALIDGGGDLLLADPPPGKKAWNIQRQSLHQHQLQNEVIPLSNCAIATSGDAYRYFEFEGKRYSHIIDPRKGYPLTQSPIISVIADNCQEADALCTAFSVLANQQNLARFSKRFRFRKLRILLPEKDHWKMLEY